MQTDSNTDQYLYAMASLFVRYGCGNIPEQELNKLPRSSSSSTPKTYSSQINLLAQIYSDVWRPIAEYAETIFAQRGDPRESITTVLMKTFEVMLVEKPELGRAVIIESHRYEVEKIRECFAVPEFRQFLSVTQAYIYSQVQDGNLLPVHAEALLELFLSVQDGMMFIWTTATEIGYPARFRLVDFETITRILVSSLFLPPTEQSREYYDSVASDYDSIYTDDVSLAENTIIGGIIAKLANNDSSILDLGCGTGLGYELLLARGKENVSYTGIDISPGMIQVAKRRFLSHSNASFQVMNIEDMSFFKNSSFDVCISLFGSFSHVLNPGTSIAEIYRVLKPGGRLFLMLYSRWSWKNFFEAITRLHPSKLAEVRPYEIRKTSGSIFADARFYTLKSISEHFKQFGEIEVRGLNCRLEIPLYKPPHGMQAVVEYLESESRRLSDRPNRCHSLLVFGRKL